MSFNKNFVIRTTFVFDFLIFLALFLTGTNFIGSILIAEAVMWLVRLIWISPTLLLYIGKRFLHMIPIILSVVALGFLLIQAAPGDPFTAYEFNPGIRPETVAKLRETFGFDKPWYIQFFRYIWNVLHLDFGFSVTYKIPVFTLVSQNAANTLLLAFWTILIGWGFSIPAGIYAATHQYKLGDQAISVVAFIGLAIPNFFLAFLLIFLVASTGSWLPLGGMTSVDHEQLSAFGKMLDIAKHMVLPVFVLATATTATLTRVMRANMLEIMNQQYITTARAKGLNEKVVVYKHALRNAINPMITIFGFQLGTILGGAALTEQVLAWPGIGKLILASILQQDLYVVVGSLVYSVALLMVGNLIADILLGVVDPRVRIS